MPSLDSSNQRCFSWRTFSIMDPVPSCRAGGGRTGPAWHLGLLLARPPLASVSSSSTHSSSETP